MTTADWLYIALPLGIGAVVAAPSVMSSRRRRARLRSSEQAPVLSWDEARILSSALSQGDLQQLGPDFYVGTAGTGSAAGAFVALLVSRGLLRRRSFDLFAMPPGGRIGEEPEVLLTTTDPAEVFGAQLQYQIVFMPSGAKSDALLNACFR